MSHLEDMTIRFQVYLEGLKTGNYAEFNRVLRVIDRIVLDELAGGELPELSRRNLEKLVRRVVDTASSEIALASEDFLDVLKDFSTYAYEFEASSIMAGSTAVGVSETISVADAWRNALQNPLTSTGTLLEPWLDKLETQQVNAIEGLLRRAHAEGWRNTQILQVLRGTRANRFTDGIIPKMGSANATIIRTAVQHVASTSRMKVWEDNPDVVKRYRWVATLDKRTSSTCRTLDGKEFLVGQGPMPPIHPNCRSTTVAVLDKKYDVFDRGATRASATGSVPQDLTYYEWLSRQSASFQDSVVGPVRGLLMRNGGINSEEFGRLQLSTTFRPLTLDEMRRLKPLAFERAGI